MSNISNATEANATTTIAPPPADIRNFQIGMTSAYVVIFVIAVLGNTLGLLVVYRKSSRARTTNVTNLFIANMAVADLLLTVTVMPFQVAYFFRGTQWIGGILGDITCKALFYIIPISIAATVFTMMLISIDRFYAIFFPLREKIFRKPKFLSAIIWIMSLVLMVPYPILFRIEFNPQLNAHVCLQVWPWEDPTDPAGLKETLRVLRIFHITVFVVLYALPLVITIVIYFLICRKLWFRKIPGNVTDHNRAAAEKSKRKVVRLLVIIVVIFALCWFPNYVNHYFWYVRRDQMELLPGEAQFFFTWLAHANSAINPCLYILLNDKFRKELFIMLSCCPCLSECRTKLARSLSSSKHDCNDNSFTTGGTMWKMMSFGRVSTYTLPRSPAENGGGRTNLSLSWMSVKETHLQPSSPTDKEITGSPTFMTTADEIPSA